MLNKSKGNMYPFVKVWLAGFTDGEGWIGISKQIRKNRPTPTYRGVITIANQKIESLKLFEREYGGRVRKEKDCYRWYCPTITIEDFLKDILPFLILKNKQAELLLSFKNYINISKKAIIGKGWKSLTKNEVLIREQFYCEMKKLNEHNFKREYNGYE